VERKFRLTDPTGFVKRAMAVGADFEPPVKQTDQYFNHPSRDFADTDEALRVRAVNQQCWLTYKGPKVDAETKTRREIELPLADSVKEPDPIDEILVALGFRPVAQVQKMRRSARLMRGDFSFAVELDEVRHLGSFVEIETIAHEDNLETARSQLAQLVEELELREELRESYLELLLAR
jgi:adenylate cyclase class 2